jgi:hypothetical protein
MCWSDRMLALHPMGRAWTKLRQAMYLATLTKCLLIATRAILIITVVAMAITSQRRSRLPTQH